MTEVPGRFLGVDFGTKRIGYAVSDDLGWTVRPVETWARRTLTEDLAHAVALIREHEIVRVVVGVPFRLDGSTGPSAERALEFIAALRAACGATPVDTRDEALTSNEADRRLDDANIRDPKERRRWRDAYAAVVILEEELAVRARGAKHD